MRANSHMKENNIYSTWALWRALLRSHWAADPVASWTYWSAAGTVPLSALLFQYFSWNFILSPLLTSISLLALSTKAEYSQAVAFSTLWTTSPDMRCTKQYSLTSTFSGCEELKCRVVRIAQEWNSPLALIPWLHESESESESVFRGVGIGISLNRPRISSVESVQINLIGHI